MSNLKENDRGYYICNGENANGASRDYVYLHVQANGNDQNERAGDSGERDDRRNDAEREREPERPDTNRRDKKPLVYLKTLTNGAPITVGQELRIICQVDDFESQVLFSKTDGAQSERARIEEVLNGHGKTMELIISPFENEDAGKYKCYARNRFGESEDTAHIELEADNSFTFKTGITFCYSFLLCLIVLLLLNIFNILFYRQKRRFGSIARKPAHFLEKRSNSSNRRTLANYMFIRRYVK